MRVSYILVALCTAVGWGWPALAPWLLGVPLGLGLVGLGIAHGACDHLLLPAAPAGPAQAWGPWWQRLLLLGYLALAGLVLLAWYALPLLTLGLFFLLSAWHWGSADAAALPAGTAHARRWWVLHSVARGLLLFAVPALARPAETLLLCNQVLALTHGPTLAAPVFAQVAGALAAAAALATAALWLGYARLGQGRLLRTDVGETALLAVLLVALPPALASGVYFVCWHSLRHVLRLLPLLPTAPTARHLAAGLQHFGRAALPLVGLSLGGLLLVGWWLGPALWQAGGLVSVLLVAASAVTLPHAALVTGVLDHARWHRTPAQRLPTLPLSANLALP